MKHHLIVAVAFAMTVPATVSVAAELEVYSDPLQPTVVSSGFDWSGVYAGVAVGYSFGTATSEYDDPILAGIAGPLDMEPTGWTGGIQLGVNHVLDGGFVLGVEGDVSFANIGDTIDDILGGAGETISSETNFAGMLRARAGFDGGMFMPFVAGGLVMANTTVSATDGDISDSALLAGWTVGGGFEAVVADNVTLKAEYLYADFGEHTWFEGDPWSSTSSTTSHTVRVGANLHFD